MGKKKELITAATSKKKSKGRRVVKLMFAIAAINGALKLYSMYKENKENESGKNKDNEVKVYKVFMNGRQVKLDGEIIQGIFVKAYLSGVDLDLRNAIITDDVFITCKSILSGISIRVPDGVNVEVSGKNILSGLDNSVPEIFDKEVPTIYIDAASYLSGIAIKSSSEGNITMDVDQEKEGNTTSE